MGTHTNIQYSLPGRHGACSIGQRGSRFWFFFVFALCEQLSAERAYSQLTAAGPEIAPSGRAPSRAGRNPFNQVAMKRSPSFADEEPPDRRPQPSNSLPPPPNRRVVARRPPPPSPPQFPIARPTRPFQVRRLTPRPTAGRRHGIDARHYARPEVRGPGGDCLARNCISWVTAKARRNPPSKMSNKVPRASRFEHVIEFRGCPVFSMTMNPEVGPLFRRARRPTSLSLDNQ